MSRIGRAIGLTRSLAIYHAIPFRQGRMRRLYRTFVQPGDLVFDIGAHAGNRARGLAAVGCRVVALEPHPDFAWLMRRLFARQTRITVVEAAVGQKVARAKLSISDRSPTVTTLAEAWRSARTSDPDFSHVRWNRTVEVEVTTIDALIRRFGVPAFVKLDIEGGEAAALRGFSEPLKALSFEYLPRALDEVEACIDRLALLGSYAFNWSPGESFQLAEPTWLNGADLVAHLSMPPARRSSGDVYARLLAPPRS